MRTEQIAELFHARLAGPDRWRAKCPVHDGRSLTSLSIGQGADGRTLLKCWAGCAVNDICTAAGIKISDLFSESQPVQRKPQAVRDAEKQVADLSGRLTPRERVLPVTIVYCDPANLDEGIARALALAVEGEIVQLIEE